MEGVAVAASNADRRESLGRLADEITLETAAETSEFAKHFGANAEIAMLRRHISDFARSMVFECAKNLE